ncbi:hypothetical protein [Caulobacter flavus]|uniref:hypothetical protein n=1 Tax=Caulobacter flavus TaxID=1679497 RepID=UPI0011AEFC8C|nr:hypothetical protein [Caulobacter flavus]
MIAEIGGVLKALESLSSIAKGIREIIPKKSNNKELFFKEYIGPFYLEMTPVFDRYASEVDELLRGLLKANSETEWKASVSDFEYARNQTRQGRAKLLPILADTGSYITGEWRDEGRMFPQFLLSEFMRSVVSYFLAGHFVLSHEPVEFSDTYDGPRNSQLSIASSLLEVAEECPYPNPQLIKFSRKAAEVLYRRRTVVSADFARLKRFCTTP